MNGIYNIGSGKKYLLKNIVKQINKMFFKRKKIFFNDLKTNQDLIANNSKIKKKGWKPKENIQNILKNYYEKIRIGIDITDLSSNFYGGLDTYCVNLIKGFSKIDTNHKIVIFLNRKYYEKRKKIYLLKIISVINCMI